MREPLQVAVFPFRMTASGPEYALFRRTDDGCWQPVAGGVEHGEDLASAARRESEEEAGLAGPMFKLDMISGVPRRYFAAARHWPEDLYIVAKHHFALDAGGADKHIVLSREHSEYRWAAYDDAYAALRYDDDKTALWELEARLRGGDLPRPSPETDHANHLGGADGSRRSVDFRTAQKLVGDNKLAKGFNRDVPTEVCLLQGELAEFFDAWRRDRPDVGEELADVVLYALGLAEILDIDLQAEIENKIDKNARRHYERGPNSTLMKIEGPRSLEP